MCTGPVLTHPSVTRRHASSRVIISILITIITPLIRCVISVPDLSLHPSVQQFSTLDPTEISTLDPQLIFYIIIR